MHVRDNDVRDAAPERLGKQMDRRLSLLVELRRRIGHAGVDEDEAVWMIDRVDDARDRVAFPDELDCQVRLDHGRRLYV